ncbi:probable endonuclease/exonuclease/phosphatase family protein [Cephalotrichum gorgonifer]|uniref:Probable endonuclease/exonuclease/phosphatase family protein n=1 Tax=Cephalotrichum gorgonifer TaxID=2041049 RepID=A0AAE8MN53_9PEZI|nr:probable endonuclease/exonuclease/phosphatase family protein [Cephalotrichum gorgonifer]
MSILAGAGSAALAATSGTLDVLSMNVAGLPPIFNGNDVPGDKTTNSRLIGSYFAQYAYDVINVQEDFNYHAYIYETDNHPYRTATTGGAAIGSGLNTLANFPWINFTRVKWDTCSNASGADCLTPKGFTFMRVQVDDGVYVDMYNLHTDAGTEPGDLSARNSNLQQVASYIDTWSTGNAVIVFGDTNSRYTRTSDDIRIFVEQNGMKDPWVELIHGGTAPSQEMLCQNPSITNECEVVDKIFYRGSAIVDLAATAWSYESSKFLQPDGNILSDHNPIMAKFDWKLSSSFRQSTYSGGPHGTWFTDLTTLSGKTGSIKTSEIAFAGASRLDSIGLTLADGTKFSHGGSGGTAVKLSLGQGEYWTSAVLCQGQKDGRTRNFYAEATTSAGKTLAAGTKTSDCSTFNAPSGWQIVGFLGQTGDEVDQLAFIYAPQ